MVRITWTFIREIASEYRRDNGVVLASALAFYAVLSAAPLLVLAVVIAGVVNGEAAARGELLGRLEGPLGREGAVLLSHWMERSRSAAANSVASILGFGVLLFAASRLFVQLQRALNIVWQVKVLSIRGPRRAFRALLCKRLLSFAMIAFVGVLLMGTLALRTAWAALAQFVGSWSVFGLLWPLGEFAISFAVFTVLFAAIYRFLPDCRIQWRDVWVGGAFTAFLFGISTMLISLYLGYVSPSSIYGAAGSLTLLLLWIYYAAQVFFVGAEFTQVWANRYGQGIVPESYAVRVHGSANQAAESP